MASPTCPSKDYTKPKPPSHPIESDPRFEINRLLQFGATYQGECSELQTVKLGNMAMEESAFFFFKQYAPIYFVLTTDGLVRYYRNKNHYYLNSKNVKGFINLKSTQLTIRKIDEF